MPETTKTCSIQAKNYLEGVWWVNYSAEIGGNTYVSSNLFEAPEDATDADLEVAILALY